MQGRDQELETLGAVAVTGVAALTDLWDPVAGSDTVPHSGSIGFEVREHSIGGARIP